MLDAADTIFALASGQGRAGIAVIRISGEAAGSALAALVAGRIPDPRRASLRRLRDPQTCDILDQALVLWFPGPESFTGEDQAELHIHGGTAVKTAVLAALGNLSGCRQAEPGEFTRRAFLNGRLDLSEVEGLADLIDAETEAQRRQALRQLEGALAGQVMAWRADLIEASACLEAALDFTDEEDVPGDIVASADRLMRRVADGVAAALAEGLRGERLRDGFTVVIAGAPNAGKSTLLNAIARRDVAIVSPLPGTTRDAIEIRCDLGGLPVTFVDTAGLRPTSDPIELAGIIRTRAHLGGADLVLWLTSPDAAPDDAAGPTGENVLTVMTKLDRGAADPEGMPADAIGISAVSGLGMDLLLERVRSAAAEQLGAGDAVVTRERHRTALLEVREALVRGLIVLMTGQDELAAEDLRLALRALGRISGRVDVEEVLDRIFGQFCIGK